MKPSEELAEKLLRQLFPEMELEYTDIGHNPGEVDFKLVDRKTKKLCSVVEVTTTTIEEQKKTIEIIKQNKVIDSKRLKRFWHLYVSENFSKIPKLSKKFEKIESYLLPIERAGILKFDAFRDGFYNNDILKIHEEMRIEAGFSYETQKPRILLSPPGCGGKISHSSIQDVVEREAFKTDNRKKLQKAENCEKHLFIIVDFETDCLTWRAMLNGYTPPDPPTLPPEINIVWLATWTSNSSYLIWRVSSANGWEILGEIDIG